jgi:hypothetical protein
MQSSVYYLIRFIGAFLTNPGMLRALRENLYPKLPIRINGIAPSWTATNIIPKAMYDAIGEDAIQSPDVVARSVIVLMADKNRHGELIYSDRGKFWDVENGENGFGAYTQKMLGENYDREEGAVRKLRKMVEGLARDDQGR